MDPDVSAAHRAVSSPAHLPGALAPALTYPADTADLADATSPRTTPALPGSRLPDPAVPVPAVGAELPGPPPTPATPPLSVVPSPPPVEPPAVPEQPLPGTGGGTRARIARRLPSRTRSRPTGAPPEIRPLLDTHRAAHPRADLRLVQRAYEVAEEAHRGQLRRSGEPFISHPLTVATMLGEFGMDTTTIVAALLHDTVEDTGYTLAEVRTDFGAEVAHLVDGVTKLDKVTFGAAAEAETIRKMIVAMARDSRVLVIKLADRLHNMRTVGFQPRHKQVSKAKATLEVLVPLANRLGLDAIRRELEDLVFQTLYPAEYRQTERLVTDRDPYRDEGLTSVVGRIQADLVEEKIRGTVTWRPRHYSSIHEKVAERGTGRLGVFDLVRVLVLVENVRDCYTALGIVHATWQPMPGRLRDFVATPKFNMYQSLHTTVIGPDGDPIDVQIRTRAMHQVAEFGVAARWRGRAAREVVQQAGGTGELDDLVWLRRLLDWQRETSDPGEYLESLSSELGEDEVMVFTPKGDVISLPAGATPVDLAYAVHTEIGHRCIGARVNGRLVPLQSPVVDGDVVEVLTSRSEGAGPSGDWLAFVTSPRARIEIRRWLARQRREEAIDAGREAVRRSARTAGLVCDGELVGPAAERLAVALRFPAPDDLFAAVGDERLAASTVVQALTGPIVPVADSPSPAAQPVGRGPSAPVAGAPARRHSPYRHPAVAVEGADDTQVRLARCCTPVPGDDVVGSVTRASGVTVHRQRCRNVGQPAVHPPTAVAASWVPAPGATFLVAIQVEALDRHGLLADTTQVLSEQDATILSASTTTTHEKTAVEQFMIEITDPAVLDRVLVAVREVEGVYDVYRAPLSS